MDEFTELQIARAANLAIDRAGVRGVLPTPLHVVAREAGIREIVDISELPATIAARKPSFMRRVLGALLYKEEVAFIDRSIAGPRVRWTEAHEVGHRILPWHRRAHELHLDDDRRLDPRTDEELEAQANAAAAQLLFQGTDFQTRAVDYEQSLAVPLLLAPEFGASLHATIRHYVETSPYALALANVGIHQYADASVPLWCTVESNSFREQYGPFSDWFSSGRLSFGRGEAIRPLGQLAARARSGEDLPTMDIKKELVGTSHSFTAEAFYNQYSIFLLVRPKSRSLGRRIRLAASAADSA